MNSPEITWQNAPRCSDVHCAYNPGRMAEPGVPGCPQFLADQLTLYQPRGAYYAHHISTGTSKFCDLPPCLQSTYLYSVIPLLVFLDDTLVSASWWSFFLSRICLFLIFYLRVRVFSGKNNTIFPSKQKQLWLKKQYLVSTTGSFNVPYFHE